MTKVIPQKRITSRKCKYIGVAAAIVVMIVVIVVTVLTLQSKGGAKKFRGAVVSNGPGCSEIGANVMSKGGTAVDAAIAALFCEGVSMPQSMGLGGGFLSTIYKRDTGEAISFNSREVAPGAASQDMFERNSSLALSGGLAVAVPGELIGYWELYKKFGGGVPWKDLIQPSIDLCYNGIPVSEYVAYILKSNRNKILEDPLLMEIFIKPNTSDVYVEGDFYTRFRLGRTLEIIAAEGGDSLHNGSLTEGFVTDIQSRNGIITIEDMNNYRPKWQTPINTTLKGYTLYSQPLPGSGAIVTLILNILDSFLNLEQHESLENYQKIIESFKFGYARRTVLGDEDFINIKEFLATITSKSHAQGIRDLINTTSTSTNASFYGANTTSPEDHGTANLCVLAPNGDAVVITSTINTAFGAGFVSKSTGIILNNEMDDFSSKNITNAYNIPPSPSNYIAPGKQPISSMSPTILVDKNGDVNMVIGGAGGSKIITSIVQVIIRHLWYGTELKAASSFQRLHHQLWPMQVDLEPLFETKAPYIAEGLREIGHEVIYVDGRGFAAVTCISTSSAGSVTGAWDIRRSGSVTYL